MEWRKIENFENYLVSDTGLIKSTKRNIILKFKDIRGYQNVTIYNKNIKKTKQVHINTLMKINNYKSQSTIERVLKLSFCNKDILRVTE